HIHAIARHQPVLTKGAGVAGNPVLVLEAALDEIVGDFRQPTLGQPPQIVKIDGGIYVGDQGRTPPDWAWFTGFCRGPERSHKPRPRPDRPAMMGEAALPHCCSLDAPYRSRRSHTNLRFAMRANRNSMRDTTFRGQQAPAKSERRR